MDLDDLHRPLGRGAIQRDNLGMIGASRLDSKAVDYNHEGAPDGITRIGIGEPSSKFMFFFIVTVIGAAMVAVALSVGWPSVTRILVGALALGLIFAPILRWRVVHVRRHVHEAMRRAEGTSVAAMARVVIRFLASDSYGTVCVQFVKSLAEMGKVGETILLWSKTPCDRIEPIRKPFEAKLLDEADGAYEELDAALSGDERRIEETAVRLRLAREDPFGLRRIKRNIRMKGGRWLVWLYLFIIATQAYRSLGQNSMSGEFWLWTAYLLLFLFVPFGLTWWKPQQWWAVPGGLVFRWAGLFDRKGKVHVFDRCSSALCIHEAGRHNWALFIADKTHSAMRYATLSEVNFLLHAWLSPLEPPPVEKLIDLQ